MAWLWLLLTHKYDWCSSEIQISRDEVPRPYKWSTFGTFSLLRKRWSLSEINLQSLKLDFPSIITHDRAGAETHIVQSFKPKILLKFTGLWFSKAHISDTDFEWDFHCTLNLFLIFLGSHSTSIRNQEHMGAPHVCSPGVFSQLWSHFLPYMP